MKGSRIGREGAALVSPFPADQVTCISEREQSPAAGGLTDVQIRTIWRSIVQYYESGLQPAISVCIRRRGAVVLERSIGHSRGNEPATDHEATKAGATPNTLFNFFSGSKSITAMLSLHLVEEGLIGLDAPVADVLDGFERHGKGRITLRHLLTHRAGLPAVPGGSIDLDLLNDREEILSRIIDAVPESEPGVEAAYHAVTGGFIIGAMVRAVTGASIRDLLHRVICEPLGLTTLSYGVPRERLGMVARECYTGPPAPAALERLLVRALGTDMKGAVQLANDPRFLQAIVPAANIIGTAHEIGAFFELLLRGGTLNGVRVFSPEMVRRATIRQRRRHEIDKIIHLPLRYGLGFMLGGEHLSFYGPSSSGAFGHLGFSQVLGWADPARDISVAFMNNGKPFVTPRVVLWWNIMRTISGVIPRR